MKKQHAFRIDLDEPAAIAPGRRSSSSGIALLPSPIDPTNQTQDGSVDMKGRPILKSRTGRWKASSFVIGVELAERIAYYGVLSNLIVYLTTVLHEGLATAIKNTTNWAGVTLVVPIVGGFLADAYWGRYWTIAVVSVVYFVGLLFLTLSATIKSLKPPSCTLAMIKSANCPPVPSSRVTFFFFSLYLISLGTGGIKPCLEAFGADQFDDEDPVERKAKSSFFNWWYFFLCVGGLFAVTVLVYIDNNVSWGLGFGIPMVVMGVAAIIFFIGTPFYRHKLPGGSPLTQIAQVLIASLRNWHAHVPDDKTLLHEVYRDPSVPAPSRQLLHTEKLKFLDKAAVPLGVNDSPWKLCTVTQVEEVKLVMRVMPIWLTTFAYGVVFVQSSTLFVKQGGTMDTRLGNFKVPAASLQALMTITVLLLLPIYDKVLVPLARRFTRNERGISMLQRIGVGLFFSILCMVVAALIEKRRLRVAKNHGLLDSPTTTIPLSAFWLAPQFFLLGIADVFTLVGQQEFFYDQVPDSMRSLGMALYLSANGVGSFINSLILTIVNNISSRDGRRPWIVNNLNRCRADLLFFLLAILSAINLVIFIIVAKLYSYKQVKSPNLSLISPTLSERPSTNTRPSTSLINELQSR